MFDQRDGVWWWVFAAALAATLAFVVFTFIGTFVLGVFLYYAARPVHRRLRTRLDSPTLAAAVALFVLALPAVLLFGYTAALAVGELSSFLATDLALVEGLLAPYLDVAETTGEFQETLGTLLADPAQLMDEDRLRSFFGSFAASVTASLGIILIGLLHLFIAVALSFYLLRDGERLADWTRDAVDDDLLRTYGRAVDSDLQTVFFGNILNALLTGTIAAIVFSILAAFAPPSVPVPVPFLLGLLAGAASLVPVVGMKIVYGPVIVVLLARALLFDPGALWFPVLFAVVTVVVVDTIPDIVIRPYVSGRNLHVGAVMFAYIFGPLLFGWYGLFLGPLLLVFVADFGRIVIPELLGSDEESAQVTLTGDPVDLPAEDARHVGDGGTPGATEHRHPPDGSRIPGRDSWWSEDVDDPAENANGPAGDADDPAEDADDPAGDADGPAGDPG